MNGGLQRDTLSVLLFAGALAPVAASVMGWPLHAPAMVATSAATCALLGAVLLGVEHRRGRRLIVAAAATAVAAAACAAILRARSNAFYTSGALVGGMIVLLTLHVGARVLRHVVLRDQSRARSADASLLEPVPSVVPALELEHRPPSEIRVVRHGGAIVPPAPSREEDVPAIALADRLAHIGAWLLALFWLLVATGHRHVATGALLLTALLLAVRCFAFFPEIVASRAQSAARGRAAR